MQPILTQIPPADYRAEAISTLVELGDLLSEHAVGDLTLLRKLIVSASRITEADLLIDWEAISRIRNRLRNAANYIAAGEWQAARWEVVDAIDLLRHGGEVGRTGKVVSPSPSAPLAVTP